MDCIYRELGHKLSWKKESRITTETKGDSPFTVLFYLFIYLFFWDTVRHVSGIWYAEDKDLKGEGT